MTKVCSKCENVGEFGPDSRNSDGLQSQCRQCRRSYQLEYGKVYNSLESTRDYKRNHELKEFWPGTTAQEARDKYNELFEDQQGCCAICRTHQSELKVSLNVDHCHKTQKVRGLLCGNCNRALGLFKDSTDNLSEAIRYLNPLKVVTDEDN